MSRRRRARVRKNRRRTRRGEQRLQEVARHASVHPAMLEEQEDGQLQEKTQRREALRGHASPSSEQARNQSEGEGKQHHVKLLQEERRTRLRRRRRRTPRLAAAPIRRLQGPRRTQCCRRPVWQVNASCAALA
ncbi:unnamed protein product [Prorocentrum cordatum]|uniref:Uncharacterized protein n=1 Tax=Prorocentrum cordatum TaxID=2364126 RepID=A0ABN9XD99_9DINO|nr:unnamed protein product [Polarella glacialis]